MVVGTYAQVYGFERTVAHHPRAQVVSAYLFKVLSLKKRLRGGARLIDKVASPHAHLASHPIDERIEP